MAAHAAPIHIGTSGWHYDHWIGPFYPEGLPKKDFLEHYGRTFRTVEINNSFYQLPQRATFCQWAQSVPDGFVFAVKASRYITHMKKLKDPRVSTRKLLERVPALGKKLGPLLFQLPPRWHRNRERLERFLDALPSDFRYAFEFRDPSWFDESVYQALAARDAAFCIYDLDGRLSPKEVTSDLVYVRLHGPEGPYRGRYDTQQLAGWAGAVSSWARDGKEVFCYFDNDEAGYAAQDAARLQEMLA